MHWSWSIWSSVPVSDVKISHFYLHRPELSYPKFSISFFNFQRQIFQKWCYLRGEEGDAGEPVGMFHSQPSSSAHREEGGKFDSYFCMELSLNLHSTFSCMHTCELICPSLATTVACYFPNIHHTAPC